MRGDGKRDGCGALPRAPLKGLRPLRIPHISPVLQAIWVLGLGWGWRWRWRWSGSLQRRWLPSVSCADSSLPYGKEPLFEAQRGRLYPAGPKRRAKVSCVSCVSRRGRMRKRRGWAAGLTQCRGFCPPSCSGARGPQRRRGAGTMTDRRAGEFRPMPRTGPYVSGGGKGWGPFPFKPRLLSVPSEGERTRPAFAGRGGRP